jgi:NAD(P)-dependent dehydrogenase (short-subunit alcohol dehydrogenase family)
MNDISICYCLCKALIVSVKEQAATWLVFLCPAEGVCLDDLHWERRKYSAFYAYSESKLANVLFSVELARRLRGNELSAVIAFKVHNITPATP